MEAPEQKTQLLGLDKFNAVQDLLNCNKILIAEIDQNHDARTPEGLARNVVLIRELNKNVAEVVRLYTELSAAVEESRLKEGGGAGQAPGGQAQQLQAS